MVEELDTDDRQQADAHGQDDGQPQVGLPQRVGRRACPPKRDGLAEGRRPSPCPRGLDAGLTGEGEDGGEEDVDPGAVDVEQDPEVDGDGAQDREAVDEGPVGRLQGDLSNGDTPGGTRHSAPHHRENSRRRRPTHLQVDGEDQGGGGDHGQGLVVGGGLPVLAHGLEEGPVRDEEDDEGHEDALEQADEEVLEVEQRPLLAWQVELGELQAQFVIHILEEEEEKDDGKEEDDNEDDDDEDEKDEEEEKDDEATWSNRPTSSTGKLL